MQSVIRNRMQVCQYSNYQGIPNKKAQPLVWVNIQEGNRRTRQLINKNNVQAQNVKPEETAVGNKDQKCTMNKTSQGGMEKQGISRQPN